MENTAYVPLLTVTQLARMLNVKPSWVYGKVASQEIPHVHVGRYPRFDVAEIRAWLRKRRGDS